MRWPSPSPAGVRLGRRGVALAAAALAAVAFLACLSELRDFDMFHHLAYGRDILRRGGFAPEDPLLYPLAGRPSGPQPSWLGSVAIYLSWRLLGDAGPLYLVGAVMAVLFCVLLADALDGDDSLSGLAVALLPLSLALGAMRGRAVPRPEMFGNLLLAWTLLALRRQAAERSRLLLWFPLAAWLWANLHQSVLAGFAAIALFLVVNGLLLAARPALGRDLAEVSGPRALLLPLAAAAAGLLLAGLASPVGFSPFETPLEVIRSWARLGPANPSSPVAAAAEAVRGVVAELRPMPPERWLGPFGWLVALSAASFAVAGARANLRELATGLAFVLLAARAARFGAMAAVVLSPVAARNLRAARARAAGERRGLRAGATAASLGAAALATAWAFLGSPDLHFGTGLSRQLPERAARYLRDLDFRGRLFNTIHLGGYLEWTLDRPVFADGRGAVPAEAFQAALHGPAARDTFAALDARYRFQALVVEYPQFEAEAMRQLAAAPGEDWGADRSLWALVAFDDGGALYLRRDGAYREAAARDEYRFARPAVPPYFPPPEPLLAAAELERSLREAPRCALCRADLGSALLAAGRPQEAEAAFRGALAGLPETRGAALVGLARAAEARGDRAAASGWYRRVLAAGGDPPRARRELARLATEDGRAALRAGDRKGALAAFREASRADPTYPDPHFGEGALLEMEGDVSGSRSAYQEYLRLAPSGPWSREAAGRLERLR